MKSKKTKKAFISMFAIFFSAIIISVLTALYVLLLKQIELMDIDSTSFQALYMADSAFECALKREQNATTSDESVFLPTKSGNIISTGCLSSGDAVWVNTPVITSGRATSKLNVSLETDKGDFCGTVITDKETRITAFFTTAPAPDKMSISGQNTDCATTTTRIVERLVEFVY